MDLNQFTTALSARRKAFTVVLGATVLSALAIALIVPKTYVSSTTLLLDARDEQSMTAGGRMSPRERAGYMQTQADLITSTKVARKALRDLKYTQLPGVREAYESETGGLGTIDDWAAKTLLQKLKADTSGGNTIAIQYSSPDPKIAADVANAFAKAYVDVTLELRTEPSREAAAWFEEQLKTLRVNVSQAQTKLTEYQKAKGISSTDERSDPESVRLQEISTQLMTARNATYDATTRQKHATEFLSNASTGATADSLPEVMASPAVQAVKAALVAAEGRLEQSAGDLGPNHPLYLRTVAEVQGLRDKLAGEMRKVVNGLSNAALQSRKREEELRGAYASQAEKLLGMRDARVELAVMTRDVDNAQRTYDAALSRFLTNKVESKSNVTNVAVLSPAIAPLEPKGAKLPVIAGLSLLIGGLLAGLVVFLLETLDRRVRSRGDLESRLAVPSLGKLSKWHPTGGRLMPALQFSGGRAARALPHPW